MIVDQSKYTQNAQMQEIMWNENSQAPGEFIPFMLFLGG